MTNPDIIIVEVSPRDGLQHETKLLSTTTKVEWINLLSAANLPVIEVTSFVSARAIPQLADHTAVMQNIRRSQHTAYSVLVPNEKGYIEALPSKPSMVAVFTAASNTFCQKNINCNIAESITRFMPIFEHAKRDQIPVRAYLSCIVSCPFEGDIKPAPVIALAEQLIALGACEISLGDTMGLATPKQVNTLLEALIPSVPASRLAVHFHDAHKQAIDNIDVALNWGIKTIDAAVGGLGGCPTAQHAPGNIATETVYTYCRDRGLSTGIDYDKLMQAKTFIQRALLNP